MTSVGSTVRRLWPALAVVGGCLILSKLWQWRKFSKKVCNVCLRAKVVDVIKLGDEVSKGC